MQNSMTSSASGIVKSILVNEGETVGDGDILVELA